MMSALIRLASNRVYRTFMFMVVLNIVPHDGYAYAVCSWLYSGSTQGWKNLDFSKKFCFAFCSLDFNARTPDTIKITDQIFVKNVPCMIHPSLFFPYHIVYLVLHYYLCQTTNVQTATDTTKRVHNLDS